MKPAWGVALTTAALLGSATCSWALEQAMDNPVLGPFRVTARFELWPAAHAGFAMAEMAKPAEDKGKTVARFELFRGDTLYFVESGEVDKLVTSVGWTKTCSRGEIDEVAGALLGGYSQQFGFPDDVLSDAETQAVAWTDKQKGLRLEILRQNVAEGSDQVDLSVVLRRQ